MLAQDPPQVGRPVAELVLEALLARPDHPVEGRIQNLALVGEVVGHGAGRAARGGGDVAQGQSVERHAGDHPAGGLGDPVAALVVVDDLRQGLG